MSYCDVDLKIVFTFNDLTIFPVYIFVFKLQLEGKCCTREKLGKKNLCISQSIYALWMTLLVESKELSECVYIKKSPMACCEPLHCNFFFPFPTGNRLRVTKKNCNYLCATHGYFVDPTCQNRRKEMAFNVISSHYDHMSIARRFIMLFTQSYWRQMKYKNHTP